MEGEAQASLHRTAAVGAVGDAAAEPLPLGSVEAGAAVVDPVGQVSGHAVPVKVLCDRSLADSLAVVTLVIMELLHDQVHLRGTDGRKKLFTELCVIIFLTFSTFTLIHMATYSYLQVQKKCLLYTI